LASSGASHQGRWQAASGVVVHLAMVCRWHGGPRAQARAAKRAPGSGEQLALLIRARERRHAAAAPRLTWTGSVVQLLAAPAASTGDASRARTPPGPRGPCPSRAAGWPGSRRSCDRAPGARKARVPGGRRARRSRTAEQLVGNGRTRPTLQYPALTASTVNDRRRIGWTNASGGAGRRPARAA